MKWSKVSGLMAAMLIAANLQAQQTKPQKALDPATQQLARDIFKQLVDIDTTASTGNTTIAAEAMRKRLLDAGFAPKDVVVLGPTPTTGNMVARLHGRSGSKLKPVLIICHLDVVEARRAEWNTDPFVFTEKDGYFYGRGTQDMKDADAAMITSFIRMKREGYVPDRDLILALTAGEESGKNNGVDWLLKNHRSLIDAEFVLNPDAGGVTSKNGKPFLMGVEATEKLYADYRVRATNPGGHSSLPTRNNAIYHVADALSRLEKYSFPFELNEVSRAELATRAKLAHGQEAVDLRAILKTPPDAAAIRRLSADPLYNAKMRTTCVATMFSAGHATNALPSRAQANVNCRILPGHSQEEVRQQLIRVFAAPTLTVAYTTGGGEELGKGSSRMSAPPPPLKEEVFKPLRETVQAIWPGMTILPEMQTGASDSVYTMAEGIPSYGFNGMAIDEGDDREHGINERLGVESYYTGVEFTYRYLKAMTGGQ
ncbi:MAG TPA: M20/M25/M40 family metallo-hydrolase [Edaphobacter sp.]|nr:M20/M25/M40 family metallo-hydrolase [Edaphobacter sp.]